MRLTIRQFIGLIDEMGKITRMEQGGTEGAKQRGLTGKAAVRQAEKEFGPIKKKKKARK